jgi:outer membrane lipoprotein SlyB
MRQSVSGLVLAGIAALFLAACASSMSGDVYSRDRAQRVQTLEQGEVVKVRPVRIEGTKSGAGTVAGGAVGAVVGSMLGGGKGSLLGAVVGGVAGAGAGAVAEEKVTEQDGLELTVKLDAGRTVVIVQAADVSFAEGDRVEVVQNPDGSARVVRP